MSEWYLCWNGAPPFGPLESRVVRAGVARGAIPPDAQACMVGDASWQPLTSFGALSAATPAVSQRPGAANAWQYASISDQITRKLPVAVRPASQAFSAFSLPVAWIVGCVAIVAIASLWITTELRARTTSAETERPPESSTGAAAAPARSDPTTPAVPPEAAAAPPAAVAPTTDAVCAAARAVPSPLCAWVAARAEGRAVTRPAFEVFQAFLFRENLLKASGRVIREADRPGRYQVTANGVWGYCLDVPSATPGELYTKWVRKLPGTQAQGSGPDLDKPCVLLEEAPLAETLLALAAEPDSDASRARAAHAMTLIEHFVPYAELGNASADEEPEL